MTYNPEIHKRRSIRLKDYDYSQTGLYFITICTQDQAHLFGKIENEQLTLNGAGIMIQCEWGKLKDRFPNIALHEFVVMPNHFHAILEIVRATLVVAQIPPVAQTPPLTQSIPTQITPFTESIGNMIGAFKSITTNAYIHGVKQNGWPPFNGKLWQRNYYEHIIRNHQSYLTISDYIVNNPSNWRTDRLS